MLLASWGCLSLPTGMLVLLLLQLLWVWGQTALRFPAWLAAGIEGALPAMCTFASLASFTLKSPTAMQETTRLRLHCRVQAQRRRG